MFLQTGVGVQKVVFFLQNGVGVQKLRVNFASRCGCGCVSKTEDYDSFGLFRTFRNKISKTWYVMLVH